MLSIFMALGGLYISYAVSVKFALRFYMLKNVFYDFMAYTASLLFGVIASAACSLPVILNSFLSYPVWQQAILPTILAIAIGESLYYRNKAWTKKLSSRFCESLKQQSRTKRF